LQHDYLELMSVSDDYENIGQANEDPSIAAQKAALNQLARPEDPSQYIAERQDMDAVEAGDQPDPSERIDRIRNSLQETQAEDAAAPCGCGTRSPASAIGRIPAPVLSRSAKRKPS
jgi:hypothetical protein